MSTTAVQRADGRWRKGRSGNPAGRPPGRLNRGHEYLRRLLEGDAECVVQAVITEAKNGNMMAAKLVLDRVLPKRACRPIDGCLTLPVIKTPADACAAMSAIANAALAGVISTSEAADLSAVIEVHRRVIETTDFAGRLERLEQRASTER
jgi:uncharacterized protein DUF5681